MAGNRCLAASGMIKSRARNADGLAVTIKPPVAEPAMLCSISLASRASQQMCSLFDDLVGGREGRI